MTETTTDAKAIPYQKHRISNKKIPPHVISIIEHLKMAGFEAYIVGGSIRDLLLHKTPKDFDIATNALPKEIKRLFRRCHIIGRRFRLAHVYYGRNLVEVATFRGPHDGEQTNESDVQDGMILRDNVYGTIEEDYLRRDLTINALYYDPTTQTLLDFCDGFSDLKHQRLRIIGHPIKRYKEDPVRMIRAVRFAGKLGFKLTPETAEPILKSHKLLESISPARLYDEALKCFHCGAAASIFPLLRKHFIFQQLFPMTDSCLDNKASLEFVETALKNTDKRLNEQKPIVAYFLFATLLWPPLFIEWEKLKTGKITKIQAFEQASTLILHKQSQYTIIPNRVSASIRDVWEMQHRLETRRPRSIQRIMTQPRFRAAYDLLLLRAKAGEVSPALAEWWTTIQTLNTHEQNEMIKKLSDKQRRKK